MTEPTNLASSCESRCSEREATDRYAASWAGSLALNAQSGHATVAYHKQRAVGFEPHQATARAMMSLASAEVLRAIPGGARMQVAGPLWILITTKTIAGRAFFRNRSQEPPSLQVNPREIPEPSQRPTARQGIETPRVRACPGRGPTSPRPPVRHGNVSADPRLWSQVLVASPARPLVAVNIIRPVSQFPSVRGLSAEREMGGFANIAVSRALLWTPHLAFSRGRSSSSVRGWGWLYS